MARWACGCGSKHKICNRNNWARPTHRSELFNPTLRIPSQMDVILTGGMEMREGLRVVGVSLIWTMAAVVAAVPSAFAAQEGHFDRTLSVAGAVDLSVQTGSGNIAVKPGDSSKVEIHATIRADHSWLSGDATDRI